MHTRQSQWKLERMASEQNMTKAIMQAVIEATKVATIAVRETETPIINIRLAPAVIKM